MVALNTRCFESTGTCDDMSAQAAWLDDYALFMALKDAHEGASWQTWESDLVLRTPAALAKARRMCANNIGRQKFAQFLFARLWDLIVE